MSISQALKISLPSINGAFEAGIAVRLDKNLPDKFKLPIHQDLNSENQLSYAAAWAYYTFNDKNATARALLTSGAIACEGAGLCVQTGEHTDGDWTKVEVIDPKVKNKAPDDTYAEDKIREALTIIVAGKANWWASNHHTGQGKMHGYIKKVLIVFGLDPEDNDMMFAAHTISHWASTLKILAICLIVGILLKESTILLKERKYTNGNSTEKEIKDQLITITITRLFLVERVRKFIQYLVYILNANFKLKELMRSYNLMQFNLGRFSDTS